jgi:hypothetical protein
MRLALPNAIVALALTLVHSGANAGDNSVTWTDAKGDAAVRRTDITGTGLPNPQTVLPDISKLVITAWQSPTPATNPYNGSPIDPELAHLFRVDLYFFGLVNPPGRLGDGSVFPYEPFRFGNNPLYGFVELDVDADKDTGGELSGAAKTRYLANIGRFGRLPSGPLAARAAVWGTDLLIPFGQNPAGPEHEYRRSGTDFLLNFCGCYNLTIISEGGNGNQVFDPGETWIVRSGFFQRSGGYREASFCFGGLSGVPGMYDPAVNLRFSHNATSNETCVSLVYALDAIGAGQIAGQTALPLNYNAGDQTSIHEGLQDVIDAVNTLSLSGPVAVLTDHWRLANAADHLDPTRWRATALLGTACTELRDSPFIWTDTGFEELPGDLNGDDFVNVTDVFLLRDTIRTLDAGPLDGDGPGCFENGSVRIIGFGGNFCVYDVNGDGFIDSQDLAYFCIADFDRDGRLTIVDYVAFGTGFAAADPRADADRNGIFDVNDFVTFGNAFAAGCP